MFKQTHSMEETIVNRNCLAKRRILTSNVRDLVGDSWGLDIKSTSIRPSAESTEIFVERCAEAQSKQCFANLVVPDLFLFYQDFQCVFPPFPWFSAGFLLVFVDGRGWYKS